MLMHRSLLLTVFILLTTVGTLTTAEKGGQTKISSNTAPDGRFIGASHGRILRGAKAIDGDATTSEEKNLLSSFVTSRLSKWRIKSWIKNKKTDNFVLSKLGIKGLTGKELTENSNFKIFQKFQVSRWLKENTPTSTVLVNLKLKDLHGADLKKADGYGTYVQYVVALGKRADKYGFEQWPKLFGGETAEILKLNAQLLRVVGRNSLDLRIMVGI